MSAHLSSAMSDSGPGGTERAAEVTDELLYTDLNVDSSVSGLDCPLQKLDHCDLLLDAIDAQLGQLQVQPHKHQAISREWDCSDAASLRWSQSMSKDTGLGSTTQPNETTMSCLDLICTQTSEKTSDRGTGCREGPVTQGEIEQQLDRRTRNLEEIESQSEQFLWRLERLLGDTCNDGSMAGETHPPSESVCTEDFVRCFRDEMVELALPEEEEEAERIEISDCEQKWQNCLNIDTRGGTETIGRKSKETQTAHYFQPNKARQRQEVEEFFSDSYGVNTSHVSEEEGAGEKCNIPLRLGEDNSICKRTEVAPEHDASWENNSHSPKARCLAGVWSFDTVSIDSDLDSACTEQVRQHIYRQPGQKSSNGNRCQNRSPSVRKAQRNKRENYRLVCSFGNDDKDTDEEMIDWSRSCRTDRASKMQSEWAKMKKLLYALQHKCQKEEETLQLKKTRAEELSLSELQKRRKHALQELERLNVETAKMEEEKKNMEFLLRDSGAEKDSISSLVHDRQRQRGSCILEPGFIMSVLEREEIDRQLDSAKTELFAEQRHAREGIESMQEKLEETCEELQTVREAESLLRTRCACLEEKQRQEKDQMERELGECTVRVGTLEKMLAQKELQLLDWKQQCRTSQAERDGLKGELQHLKTQHYNDLKEAQGQSHRMMEAALKQQKKDLVLAHEQQIQKVNKQNEEEKANALKEQAASLTQHIESMKNSIELKEEEAKKLRDSLDQQREAAKICEEELHVKALEKVHEAVEEEREKREAEKVEAVQVHCGILKKQNRKSLEIMKLEMQWEKSKSLALQHKVAELKTKVQQMESEHCTHKTEQESLLAVICKSLKEEHQVELHKLQKQMAQDSQRAVLRLEWAGQLAEREADRLRMMLEERESSHNRITAELEQQLLHCAQELGAECQHLHLLVQQTGDKHSSVQIPPSLTVAEALTTMTTLRELLKHLISHLHQEIYSHKQTTEQLKKDRELELSFQRQQMRMDRDQALDSLKERLIQEHIEELSSLNCALKRDGGVEGEGAAASLRKQLKAKDLELRQVQRSMSQWKEQTAARLACKFEEELTAELERKKSKAREEMQRKPERSVGETTPCAKEAQNSVCSPSLHVAASHSPSDVASFKLLRYLQSRVKQLRLENQASTCSPSPSNTIPLDLSGSFLTTITQGQDIAEVQSHSSVRTVSS